jgi:hypothetical protein
VFDELLRKGGIVQHGIGFCERARVAAAAQSEGPVIGNLFFKRFDQRGVIIRRRLAPATRQRARTHARTQMQKLKPASSLLYISRSSSSSSIPNAKVLFIDGQRAV